MTKLKLLLGGMIATTLLTTPVLARESQPNARHVAEDRAGIMPDAHYVDGRLCTPAPRVGAFATQPWDNDTPCEPSMGY